MATRIKNLTELVGNYTDFYDVRAPRGNQGVFVSKAVDISAYCPVKASVGPSMARQAVLKYANPTPLETIVFFMTRYRDGSGPTSDFVRIDPAAPSRVAATRSLAKEELCQKWAAEWGVEPVLLAHMILEYAPLPLSE